MKRFALTLCLLMFFGSAGWCLEIADSVITTAVEDRAPVDRIEVFSAADGRLFCFTRVVGAEEPTEILHLWYHEDQLRSRVLLPVRSPDWRTWSSKKFSPEWRGEWRVEIRDAEENLLESLRFTLI